MATKKTAQQQKTKTPKTGTTKTVAPVAAVASPSAAATLIGVSELTRLRTMNLWVAVAFAVQAVAVWLLGGAKAAPVTMQYLAPDQLGTAAAGHQVYAVATRHLLDLRFTAVAAGFLLLLALANVLYATLWRPEYEASLQRGHNVARWLGLAVGGGVMIAALGLETGVYNLAELLILFVCMAVGIGLEPLAEKINRSNPSGLLRHAVCAAAVVLVAVPWVVFALGILGALLWKGHIPGNVYTILGTSFVLLGAWVLAAHYRITGRGRWVDTLYAEKMYMFLSLAAASALAWQMFAGAL